ncbi:Helitron helicase-like domain at N-terminus, partial [Rhizoctonia solani]
MDQSKLQSPHIKTIATKIKSQPTTPERNQAQARGEDHEQQAQTSPNAQCTPSSSLPAAQFGVMSVDPPARNQAFSNHQLAQHRQFTLVAAPNAETIQSNPLNPPPGPSHAALAQMARQAREHAEREVAVQAMQAQQPPNIALIPEELLPAPLDPPQILENQQVPVNIEDNQGDINQEPPGNNIEQGDAHAHPQPNEQPLPPAQLNEAAQECTAAKEKCDCVVSWLSCTGQHDLGPMNVRCPKCQAWHWDAERLKGNTITFGSCCLSGQIGLPPPRCPPRELWELYTGRHHLSQNFQKNIQALNAALAFTSFGATSIGKVPTGQGPYIFKIGGEVHHLSGVLDRTSEGQQAQYAQLYLYDPHDAANFCTRNQHNARIDPGLMCLLTGVIHESHGYAALYKQAWQRMQEQPVQTVSIVLCQQQNTDPRRYNLPTSDEIALILADNALNQQHDIVLFKHHGGFQRMSSWNPAYACLHYVLLFPKGEHGFQRHIPIQGWQWQPGLHPQAAQRIAQLDVEGHEPDDDDKDNGPAGNQWQRRSVVSEREYYAYYLFSCEDPDVQTHYPGANGAFSTIFWAGHLFQQYLVDVWAIADQSRLLWLHNNQSSLRVELYSGLCDALLSDNLTHGEQVGCYILPSSYYGGPQQMAESYQDAMAISCYLGGPQLFITMTANPKWPEIHSALLPGQTYSNRPDLITQVFELKCHQLMEDITQKGIFGKCIAHVHTIEFQKRGLPHMHLLVWLECASHILEPGDVDELIFAELPIAEGPGADPALYAVITSSMLHGPCGPDHSDAACWDKDKKACTKGYYPLKQWNAQTIAVADSYPLYWHRDNGQTLRKIISGIEITFDNRHVVPHNPFLSKRYTCHINVETCSGIRAIKYVFKYVYKGGDRISIELTTNAEGDAQQAQNLDEIRTHLDACWVSPYEALWQLLKFSLHQEVPNLVSLQVHLPEQQSVSFCAGQLIENVISAAKDTSLTAFFKLSADENQEVCRFANELVYQEIPNKFTWNKTTQKFSLQRFTQNNGVVRFSTGAIGRMYFVPPNSGERFYLRTLLTVVHGPTSFESLHTFEGQVFPTFKEACIAQGLLESDEEWARYVW